MTAKEYLQQVDTLNKRINIKLAMIDDLKIKATNISATRFDSDSFGGQRKRDPPFVRCIEKIYEMEQKLDAEIDQYYDTITEIEETLHKLNNGLQEVVLYDLYINQNHKTIEQVAAEQNYSAKQMRRIHDKALSKLEDVLKCP